MKTNFCGEHTLCPTRYEAPSVEVMGFSASSVLCASPFGENQDFTDNGTVDWFER